MEKSNLVGPSASSETSSVPSSVRITSLATHVSKIDGKGYVKGSIHIII